MCYILYVTITVLGIFTYLIYFLLYLFYILETVVMTHLKIIPKNGSFNIDIIIIIM